MVICLFAFPERDPGGFLPIANLNTNVCVEAVVGQMKPHHVFHVKGGPQAVPSTSLHPPAPTWSRTHVLVFQNRVNEKRDRLAGPGVKIPSKTEENGKLDKVLFCDVLADVFSFSNGCGSMGF
jgi:hypothetical protein